jgi:hypothetical protein
MLVSDTRVSCILYLALLCRKSGVWPYSVFLRLQMSLSWWRHSFKYSGRNCDRFRILPEFTGTFRGRSTVGVARCDTAERSLFFGITDGTDENGISDVDSVVLGTGTESGICNLDALVRQYLEKIHEESPELFGPEEDLPRYGITQWFGFFRPKKDSNSYVRSLHRNSSMGIT